MTWIKRVSTFALIALLVGGLAAACGGDDTDDADTGDETAVVDPAQQEEDEATPTDGAAEETVEPDPTEADGTASPDMDATPPATGSPEGSPQADLPGSAVTIDDILEMPDTYVEEDVTVTGEVVEVLMAGAFTISATDDADEQILVVGAGDLMPVLDEGSTVMVEGQVDMLTIDEDYLEFLREEFDLNFEDDELLTEFDGQPVIAASSVSLTVASIAEIVEAPDPFIDQMVTLTGPVAEQVNPLAFVMSNMGADWTAEESLLVIGPSGIIPPEIDLDAMYQVRGTVRMLDLSDTSELGDEYTFLTEDDEFSGFDGSPVIVAEEVEHAAPPDALAAILDEPNTFVDQTVQVSGQVVELVGMQGFTIGSDETDDILLVITTTPTLPADLEAGTSVTVSGMLMLFDRAALEEELEIDLEDDLLGDFDGQPVLVAEVVMAARS